jgi:hypothetical protein
VPRICTSAKEKFIDRSWWAWLDTENGVPGAREEMFMKTILKTKILKTKIWFGRGARLGHLSSLVAVAGMLLAGAAQGLVLEETSEDKKLRQDIGKQLTNLAYCYGKAWQKCEKKTDPFTNSCSLVTGQTDLDPNSPGDLSGKFAADIAKCETKVDFLKKAKTLNATTGYEAIGCRGDSDSGTPGEQPFADLTSYEAGSKTLLRSTAGQLGLIPGLSGCDPESDDADKCVTTLVKTFSVFTKAIGTCSWKCENDYRDKKGNGGPNDDDNCSIDLGYATTSPTPDPNMTVCADKALAKMLKKYPGGLPSLLDGVVMPIVADQLNSGNDIYYNVPGNCPAP